MNAAVNKYRVAVCDDDPVLLGEIGKMCGSILDEIKIRYEIAQFPSAAELGEVLKRMQTDLMFSCWIFRCRAKTVCSLQSRCVKTETG